MFTELNGIATNEILPLDAPELLALRFGCGKLTPVGQVSFEAHCSKPPPNGFIDVISGPKGMMVLASYETVSKTLEVIGFGKGEKSITFYLNTGAGTIILFCYENQYPENIILQTPDKKNWMLQPGNLTLHSEDAFKEGYCKIAELTGLNLPALPPNTMLHRFEITGTPLTASEKSQWNLNLKIAHNYNESRGQKMSLQELIQTPGKKKGPSKKWWRFW
jgi:hypothetical protein